MILQNGRASFGGIKCKDFLMDHAQGLSQPQHVPA